MPMNPETIASNVKLLAQEARDWDNSISPDRMRAMEYYDGTMHDTPFKEGRSSVVSKDLRAAQKKVVASISRAILRNAELVKYDPVGEGDEELSEQASDFVNYIVVPECGVRSQLRDAVDDATKIENGILKWWHDDSTDIKVSSHSGLNEAEFMVLAQEPDAEIIEYSQEYDGYIACKVRRVCRKNMVRLSCIPREEFLIDPDALTIEDAIFVCHNQRLRRHQLIAMGYDRKVVEELPAYGSTNDGDVERSTRRDDVKDRKSEIIKSHEEIDYYECYVRLDVDDDGIAELRRIIVAGGWDANHVLENTEADEIPFADVVIERRTHEWRGRSLATDLENVQRVKTVLLRQTLDNLYAQNNAQPIMQNGGVENVDAVFNPAFGKPIITRAGVDVRSVLGDRVTPFTADKSYAMLEYMDQAASDLTGVSDNSAGMPSDALSNVTAKASAMIEQVGTSSIEDMAACVAEGFQKAFRGLLRLIIKHQDKPRMVRLRDKWVEVDPRSWNAGMDCTINTGLGAGTRERDMMAVSTVVGLQEKLLAAFGAESNPFVKPDDLYNGIADMVKAAGLQTPGRYFTSPDPQEIEALLQAKQNQPNPEEMKLQAQMQLEQMKAQAQVQREQAQMEADLQTKQADSERAVLEMQANLQADMAKEQQRLAFEREKAAADNAFRAKEIELKEMDLKLKRNLEITKLRTGEVKRMYGETAKPREGVELEEVDPAELQLSPEFESDANPIMDTLQKLSAAVEGMAKPKRVVRDELGEIIGVETVN